ncbi:Adenosylmethionine-8-amino-7-oxononanoate aminotransferase [Mameliella alba]|uniref:aminotransferase family protein n=1 Tax=Mameliella alba TaxID=561184 RepID=UPI00088901F5|nr:aspartate aminotransferase family protein [Mameliella alba]OWV43559.1 aspartate aminotransferase family protein [Mameliella alba]PTR36194.1 adenosylmethionine-8-amino-7-oxononanoate aminotransferase [Mameliella alba]GGF80464.1 aspartate aminotransferase family protein [Mameliella alba]SDD99976.1 Adenosylmethionine-8-amino-7-oxononanoate aminotransferase [Mameliella alba]
MSKLFYQGRGRKPVLDQARGVYMWDKNGRRYLDGSSGAMVCNIGHSNEHVLAAMQRQMEKSTFGYRLHFETEASENMAEKLAEKMPEGLDRVFFVSGGSEAVESAMKLARQYALAVGQGERWKIISRTPSYHGCTLGALATTGYTTLTAPFEPMMRVMPKVPAPRAYLDGLDPDDAVTGRHYADMLARRIEEEGPENVLAFIVEPIGGASTGALVSPAGYLERVREICDQYGILLILDEVMTGAGRTGAFLGVDHWGVRPDIVVMSKGIGSGYAPLGAMVADRRLVEPVLDAGGFAHGFTYAGNPLACAAGLAVLEEIDRQDLCTNAAAMGEKLLARLNGLMQRHEIIGDVRGKGLLTAFEFMSDRSTKAPLPKQLNAHQRFVDIAYERGLIVYSRRTRDGVEGDHILVCPPLILNEGHIDEIIEGLDESLVQFAQEIAPVMQAG